MKWEDKMVIVSLVVLVFVFPISAAYIEYVVGKGLDVWVQYRSELTTPAVVYLIGWFVYKYKTQTKVKIPKKTAKTKKAGKFLDD